MGKKYLDTKESTLESSILGVWESAAEKTLERAKANLDARTKEYKVHQEKLTAARLRRENSKKLTKEEVDLDEGYLELTFKSKQDAEKAYNKINNEIFAAGSVPYDDMNQEGNEIQFDLDGNLNRRNDILKDLKSGGIKNFKVTANEDLDEGTKEEYEKFFNGALKKFKIDSPADLKSDEEKKKFFNYIDKNYTGEKDEGYDAFMKEKVADSKLTEGFAVPKDIPAMEVGTDRYREYASNLTPGETDPEWVQARDFKVASMKEALAKVWGLDEKALDKTSKEDYDEEDEELKPVKGSKTMTGGKVAKVETKPKID